MSKGMILTVGVGKGIEHAIVLSIRNSNPDMVVFVVTPQSRQNTLQRIEAIANELQVSLPPYELEEMTDENDVEKAYEAVASAIKKLGEKGIRASETTIDYTTGSKPMSAGALFAAIMEGCEKVVYVTGQRDPDTGRVISGTERFLTFFPSELAAKRFYLEAIALFNSHQFQAAKQLISRFLGPYELHTTSTTCLRLRVLRNLCDGYEAWDAFDHDRALEAFRKVDDKLLDCLPTSKQILKNREWVGRIASKLKSNDPGQRLCDELLVDLWANALRRLEERRFVDAVARLYRLTELIAQFRLWHHHRVDTSDVKLSELSSKISENMVRKLEGKKAEKGSIQTDLQADFELLDALDDPLGKALEDSRLRDALRRRNNSIGAHGLEPVSEEHANTLKEAVEPLLTQVLGEWRDLLKHAIFPTLTP